MVQDRMVPVSTKPPGGWRSTLQPTDPAKMPGTGTGNITAPVVALDDRYSTSTYVTVNDPTATVVVKMAPVLIRR
ncbi:hypothetical protein ABFK62_15695 [Acinetobacter baumannii]|uniref:hypothetical protein n=1 Tax=Acinetobacter baumannii TaxID=470 RepID=UPI00321C102F